MHGDPYHWFVDPVKQAIRETLLEFTLADFYPGVTHAFTPENVSFNGIERAQTVGATIMLSKQIQPSLDRKDEKPAGGRTELSWTNDAGERVDRHLRSTFRVYFDVDLWMPKAAYATCALFHLVGNLPRSTVDGMTRSGLADPGDFRGNPVLLDVISPLLPEDLTSVSKSYRARAIVRAEGGIYVDRVSTRVRGAGRIQLASPPFVEP